MSLHGRAFLAFSHDVTPGNEPDWTEWHDREHIPERLATPGFLRLRRYVSLGAGPRFFYFYETDDLDVLQSPAYLDRLGHPTEWTKRCIQYVCNNRRSACRLTATLGRGLGGSLAVLAIPPPPVRAHRLGPLPAPASPPAHARPRVVGAHRGEPDAAPTAVGTDEKKLLPTPDAMAQWIAMIEGVDRDAVAAASAACLGNAALTAAGASGGVGRGFYQLVFTMDR